MTPTGNDNHPPVLTVADLTAPAIYNEIDPFAAAWMRELVAAGHIAPGVVDERSISDLTPADVAGPGQRHFFAGIGGWSYALRLAGVPDDASIWTGSCPCQPFSAAGKRGGTDDARHLWPAWFALIRECRPAIVFGEQVASDDGLAWLDAVYADLEGAGYAVGSADLCAAGVGAPQIRQRIYFVAYADDAGRGELGISGIREDRHTQPRRDVDGRGAPGMAHDAITGRISRGRSSRACDGGDPTRIESRRLRATRIAGSPVTDGSGLEGRDSRDSRRDEPAGPADFWSPCDWLPCIDGVSRPVEPGTFPLAHGVPARVGRLRGYGNAIVPQVAATFIRAAIEAIEGE
jgi:DNA (cytosine-5)-methyltransferase 1